MAIIDTVDIRHTIISHAFADLLIRYTIPSSMFSSISVCETKVESSESARYKNEQVKALVFSIEL